MLARGNPLGVMLRCATFRSLLEYCAGLGLGFRRGFSGFARFLAL